MNERTNSILRMLAVSLLMMAMGAVSASASYSLTLVGDPQYNYQDKTSTWTYRLTWNKDPNNPSEPELSHLSIGLCGTARVISASPEGWVRETQTGSNCSVLGIKWNVGESALPAPEAGASVVVSFTLAGMYAAGPVPYAAKAGNEQHGGGCNFGEVTGPNLGCTKIPVIAIDKSCVTPHAFGGGTVQYVVNVENTGEVDLSNIMILDPGAIPGSCSISSLAVGASASCNFTGIAPMPNPGVDFGDYTNIATAIATGPDGASAHVWDRGRSCSYRFWRMRFPGDLIRITPTYTRDWTWNVQKLGPASPVDIPRGSTGTLGFNISLTKNGPFDSGHAVSGSFVAFNPAPIAATVASATVSFTGVTTPVSTSCTSGTLIPPGGSVTCSFESTAVPPSDGTATFTMSLTNGGPFQESANYQFGAPTTENNACVNLSDTYQCPAGFSCGPVLPPALVCESTNLAYSISATNNAAPCDEQNIELVNTARVSSGASSTATAQITTPACPTGCTLTIGYWKTHAGFTGRNADRVTPLLPQLLGSAGGAKTVSVTGAGHAVWLLSMSGEASNGINKLYAQLLGTKLNIASGASGAPVASSIGAADAFLATKSSTDWKSLTKAQQNQVLGWMSTFDRYNNGLLGVPHCD